MINQKASSKLILLEGNLATELKTITIMVTLYCRAHHAKALCNDCQALIDHAQQKLDRCVFGQQKPACKKCTVHCYKPNFKQQAKVVMKETGMKMLYLHPVLALKHLLKGLKKFPTPIPVGLSNYHQRKQQLSNSDHKSEV
jgi:hypothetical protein